ncbi:MAG: hypothetical protein CM15mV129_330 [uncultured marine virus]|nr:MAG: hypothetical protein CM15mV129_330 [uncultured marine virus]
MGALSSFGCCEFKRGLHGVHNFTLENPLEILTLPGNDFRTGCKIFSHRKAICSALGFLLIPFLRGGLYPFWFKFWDGGKLRVKVHYFLKFMTKPKI